MDLILVRHAKAELRGSRGNDYQRALTEKGEKQSRAVARFLLQADLVPDVVLSSPVLRAEQTAKIVCAELGSSKPHIEPWLSCGMDATEALRELVAYQTFEKVMLVGHEPDFSFLAQAVLGVSHGALRVRKASVIWLRGLTPPSRGATLELIVAAKMMAFLSQ